MLINIIKVLAIIVLLELAIIYGGQVYDEFLFWKEYHNIYTDFSLEE